jgi:hypothetical protein
MSEKRGSRPERRSLARPGQQELPVERLPARVVQGDRAIEKLPELGIPPELMAVIVETLEFVNRIDQEPERRRPGNRR